jgi:hypothetical protein
MVRGEPSVQKIHYDDWFQHLESIDIGYYCPKCDAWNACRNEIHPEVLERKMAREKRDQEIRDRMDQEIRAAEIALKNKIEMRKLVKESTSNVVQVIPH